jgi:RNA polymerase sigma factor (sigma-70 family)
MKDGEDLHGKASGGLDARAAEFRKLGYLRARAAWRFLVDPVLLDAACGLFQEKVRRYNNGSPNSALMEHADRVLKMLREFDRLSRVSAGKMAGVQKQRSRLARKIARHGFTVGDMCEVLREAGRPMIEDVERALACRNALVEKHLGLAKSVLRKTVGGGNMTDDLLSAATEGLISGVDHFDPYRGTAFSTSAAFWIKKAVYAEIRARTETPESYAVAYASISRCLDDGSDIREEDLRELTGLPESTIRAAMEFYRTKASMVSLDDYFYSEKRSWSDAVKDTRLSPEEAIEEKELLELVKTCIARLPSKDREILKRRMKGATLREIGEMFGMTAGGVHAAEKRTLGRIRKNVASPAV